jgi:hypothetical protein
MSLHVEQVLKEVKDFREEIPVLVGEVSVQEDQELIGLSHLSGLTI